MKHWKISGYVLFALLGTQAPAHAADTLAPNKQSDTGTESHRDASVRTAYELRIKAADKPKLLDRVAQKIKESSDLLQIGECRELKLGHAKKDAPTLSYNCDKPSAATDDFFRSLVSLQVSDDCTKVSPPISLRTYSAVLTSKCTFAYCCGPGNAVPCQIVNRTKPCPDCRSY